MKRFLRCAARVAVLSCALPAAAEVVSYQEAQLVAGDAAPWNLLGAAISISGNTLVAGAPWDDDAGADSGAVYVFVRSGASWAQQAKLVAADAHGDDRFGSAVSIDGDRLVVGSPFNDDAGLSSGSAYVFVRNGTSWTQEAKLVATDAAVGDSFGTSVAIRLDTVAVGAAGDDAPGPFTGSAYVFVRVGPSWTQQAKLLGNPSASYSYFGTSISLDVDWLVVGATRSALGAFVYERIGTTWLFRARLTDPAGQPPDLFGSAVSIRGDRAAVGGPQNDSNGPDSGVALVFVRSGGTWTLEARLVAGEGYGRLGSSVALSGDLLVAGAPFDRDYGPQPRGAAFVFQREGTSWGQTAHLVPADAADLAEFGASASLDGDTAAVGAPRADAAGVNAGAAYSFRLIPAPFAFCPGDGSGTPCPCGNEAPGGGGCANSSGVGAVLDMAGVPSAGEDGFTFTAENLLPSQPALLFAGDNAVNGGDGNLFGDGLRCAGGNVVRLGVKIPDANGSAEWGPGLGALGGWSTGDTRRFQCWYRNPSGSPCGTGFNLSNGIEAIFIP